MSGTWWSRFSVIVITVLWGIWMVAPTFLGESSQQMLEAQAAAASGNTEEASDAEVEGPWWLSLLPEGRISLGLDLQGGIDMTLSVEVDEAVVSAVHRDVGPLKTMAAEDGLRLADVRRKRGEPIMLLTGEDGVPSEEIRRL